MRRRTLLATAGLATTGLPLVGARPARAADYPTRTVRMLVGFPPGGASDILARISSQELNKVTGQSFVVENRGGANSLIATQELIRARPDGATLLMTHTSVVTNAFFYPGAPYDPVQDVTLLATVARSPFVLLANPGLGVRDMAGLLAKARAQPGAINYGSPGLGSMQHLSQELLNKQAGVTITHIPFNGGGPSVTALIGGQVQVMFSTTLQAMPFIRSGQLVPLAVSSPGRLPELPDVAPVADSVPGFQSDLWHGLVGPKAVAPELVARINTLVGAAVASDAVQKGFATQGLEAFTNTPAQCAALLASEAAKWRPVLAGLVPA